MLWIAESVEKLWHAYTEGLQLSCTVHRDASRDEEEGDGDVASLLEQSLSLRDERPMVRGFN